MNSCFIFPNPDLFLLLGLLFCIFLLMAVSSYFAVEAICNHSRIIHAYWVGKSEGLEQVIQLLKEKSKAEPLAPVKDDNSFKSVNGC